MQASTARIFPSAARSIRCRTILSIRHIRTLRVPAAILRIASSLKRWPTPFYGNISQGVLQNANVTANQLARPFPQYGSISNSGNYVGVSNYQSLQMKLEKRFSAGGTLLGAYTFSKLLTNAEYLTSWLDSTTTAGYQVRIIFRVSTRFRASIPGSAWSSAMCMSYPSEREGCCYPTCPGSPMRLLPDGESTV